MDTIEGAFDTFGLAAICVLMLAKAAGIPIPIPGDLIVLACGLAGLSLRAFLPPLLLATGVDLVLHFALGVAGGSLLNAVQPDPRALALAIVLLAAIGLVGWLLVARRRRSPALAGGASLAVWEATACPVCLALGAFGAPASMTPAGLSGTRQAQPRSGACD